MSTRFVHVTIDSARPSSIARFWSALLGWPIELEDDDEVYLGGTPIGIAFVPVAEPKTVKNRVHLDLASATLDHQAQLVARAESLGAKRIDIGQGSPEFVVMADPDGNEFCVLEPRSEYANAGVVAAVVQDCHDPVTLAPFWSAATGWPILKQAKNFTALRSSDGAGPLLALVRVDDPKSVKHRVHVDVAPYAGDDHAAEVSRLLDLGARRADIGQGDVPWAVLVDPEGNELCVLTPR